MSGHIVTTSEELPVTEDTHSAFDHDGQQVRVLARGRVTAHELLSDVDGAPLGVAAAGRGYWEVGDIVQ